MSRNLLKLLKSKSRKRKKMIGGDLTDELDRYKKLYEPFKQYERVKNYALAEKKALEIMNMNTDGEYNITELKKNYRKLSLKWHPDKNPDNNVQASEIFKITSNAFHYLEELLRNKPPPPPPRPPVPPRQAVPPRPRQEVPRHGYEYEQEWLREKARQEEEARRGAEQELADRREKARQEEAARQEKAREEWLRQEKEREEKEREEKEREEKEKARQEEARKRAEAEELAGKKRILKKEKAARELLRKTIRRIANRPLKNNRQTLRKIRDRYNSPNKKTQQKDPFHPPPPSNVWMNWLLRYNQPAEKENQWFMNGNEWSIKDKNKIKTHQNNTTQDDIDAMKINVQNKRKREMEYERNIERYNQRPKNKRYASPTK